MYVIIYMSDVLRLIIRSYFSVDKRVWSLLDGSVKILLNLLKIISIDEIIFKQ